MGCGVSGWKPISQYPTTAGTPGPVVLARTADKAPMLVLYQHGHFYICPGIPMFYGEKNFGFVTADHVIEYMDIPE